MSFCIGLERIDKNLGRIKKMLRKLKKIFDKSFCKL